MILNQTNKIVGLRILNPYNNNTLHIKYIKYLSKK